MDEAWAGAHSSAMKRRALCLAAVLLPLMGQPMAAQIPVAGDPPPPGPAVWFGIHFNDTSNEGAVNGIRADETERVAMIGDFVAEDLTARGFSLMTPAPDEVADLGNPADSNGRDTRIAARMGADYAISGEVTKVSNLILSLSLHVRDARTARTLRAATVDIRGNTDESYQRGYSYLLRNIIFRKAETE